MPDPEPMTVGELKDHLDDYGDHLPVMIEIAIPGEPDHYEEKPIIRVDETSLDGSPAVLLVEAT